MSRKPRSVRRYDRDEIARVVAESGQDAALARWPTEVVRSVARGIGKWVTPRRSDAYDWTPEADALLGTMPDTLIGAKLGVSHMLVSYRRKKLGIGKFRRDPIACIVARPDPKRRPRDRQWWHPVLLRAAVAGMLSVDVDGVRPTVSDISRVLGVSRERARQLAADVAVQIRQPEAE